ncbi:Mur ligase family protein [Patescibacteria group bacterium]|nr:Mur ligase family protein [Patescibacteria group bacterium]
MTNPTLIILGKSFSFLIKNLNLGHGSTWPGHIALKANKSFIEKSLKRENVKTIVIAGTNGKTTTSKLLKTIIEKNEGKVFQNQSGANLLNGIASTIILESNINGKLKKDFAVLEVDENTLPLIVDSFIPDYIIALNLFRDQLDRYGEVDTIAEKWKESFKKLPESTTVILNADDPLIAFLGKDIKAKTLFFGLNENSSATTHEAADSVYCPICKAKLEYSSFTFSHLGNWSCVNCNFKKPILALSNVSNYPLSGTYNKYNTLAAILTAKTLGFNNEKIEKALLGFSPAFGRQEVLTAKSKKVQIILAKNPTSFNESLKTIDELSARNLLLVLNDRIPDGKDVSWIWDTNLKLAKNIKNITVSGDRAFDMALRVKYSDIRVNIETEESLKIAIRLALEKTGENETLFILPTYSAMLEVRKILTGKKIL